MMNLISEQVENLKKFYEEKSEESKKVKDMITATSKPIVCDSNCFGDSVDNHTRTEDANLRSTLSFAEYILDNHNIIENIENGKVNIGTTFTVTINFEGRKNTTTKTLVETMLPCDDYRKYISLESTVGKTILGRSVGETFTYTQGNSTIIMTIDEIVNCKKFTR